MTDSIGKGIVSEPGNVRSQKSKAKACKPHRTAHTYVPARLRAHVCLCVCTWCSVAEIMKLLTLEQLPAKKQKRCNSSGVSGGGGGDVDCRTKKAPAARQKKEREGDREEGKKLAKYIKWAKKACKRPQRDAGVAQGAAHAAIIIAVQTWLWFATENRKASEKPKRRKKEERKMRCKCVRVSVCVCVCGTHNIKTLLPFHAKQQTVNFEEVIIEPLAYFL